MSISRHGFTEKIDSILKNHFRDKALAIFEKSELIQYLNIKTRAANRGSKARAGFANLYAIYVLIEDYINGDFNKENPYEEYEGARFSSLLKRQRELPFGSKLQNHALNHRLNQEFKKHFPNCVHIPIVRDASTNRYWFNEKLIKIKIGSSVSNIAQAIKEIIDTYISTRQSAFYAFMDYCEQMIKMKEKSNSQATEFIEDLMKPNVDARIYEIVSYAVLKEYYADQIVFWGWSPDELTEEPLVLYKTGRTNANDGGIDFVMKPLGKFFQVTETIDAEKYFLDINKVQRYPVTFVVKTNDEIEAIRRRIQEQAKRRYNVNKIVQRYMDCIEEIINIPILMQRFEIVLENGGLHRVISEIMVQSRLEFNEETVAKKPEKGTSS